MSRREGYSGSSLPKIVVSGFVMGLLIFLWAVAGLFLTGECAKGIKRRNVKAYRRLVEISPWDAEAWYVIGRIDYYMGNYGEAEEAYTRVLSINPLFYRAWVELLWLSLKEGVGDRDKRTLIRIIDTLNPTQFDVHWNLLLFALTIDKPWARQVALGEIRLLLPLYPEKRTQLFTMASRLLGGEENLLNFVPVEEKTRKNLLHYLLFTARRSDVALSLWNELQEKRWADDDLFREMINGLMRDKNQKQAWELWHKHFKREYHDNLIFNGSFESEILNFGFSWRYHRNVKGMKKVRVIHYYKIDGSCSFSLTFDGEHNPNVLMPYQYVYFEPGSFRVQASMASKKLTSASGFSLEVSGPGIYLTSPEVKGDTEWKKVDLSFQITRPGVYRIGFRRKATQKLNRFLGGEVFFDEVSLVKENGK